MKPKLVLLFLLLAISGRGFAQGRSSIRLATSKTTGETTATSATTNNSGTTQGNKTGSGWLGGTLAPNPSASSTTTPNAAANPALPVPVHSGLPLLGKTEAVGNAKATPVEVATVLSTLYSPSIHWPSGVWTPDGHTLFLLDAKSVLHRVAYKNFVETDTLTIPDAVGVAMSQAGVVVGFSQQDHLWILDPQTLSIRRQIFLPAPSNAAVAPASSWAYVGHGRDTLSVVNLITGEIVNQYHASDFRRPIKHTAKGDIISSPSTFGILTISDDGKTLFCEDSNALHHFRVNRDTIAYEDSSPRLGDSPQYLALSSDGAYVALLDSAGNHIGDKEIDPITNIPYSIFIFKTGDLQNPVLTLRSDLSPRVLTFDKAGRRLYTQNASAPLIVFNAQGILENKYSPSPDPRRQHAGGDDVELILPHPAGKRVLLVTEGMIWWVELPGAPTAPMRSDS